MSPQELEPKLREAVDQALRGGAPPILVLGLLEAIKLDLHARMRELANQGPQIVRGTMLPPNGRLG